MLVKSLNFFENTLNVKKPVLCILTVFLIKVLYSIWFNKYSDACIFPNALLANIKGDSNDYISAAINLKNLNFYYPDLKAPGYSLVIYFFLFFTNIANAIDCVVITQLITSSISVYILSKLGYLCSKSNRVFTLIFIFYGISSYVTEYDRIILAESLAVSLLIFSIYFFYKGLVNNKSILFLYAGLGFCFTIYLRPILVVLTASLIILSILQIVKKKHYFKEQVRILTLCVIPFLTVLLLWGFRNYVIHQKIEPMMRLSGYYDEEKKSYYYDLHRFVETWSGDIVFWDATAEINWFGCDTRFKSNDNIKLPNYIFTTKYNHQALVDLRAKMRLYDSSQVKDSLLKNEICHTLQNYAQSFKSENPVLYYILPFKIAAKFVVNGGGTTSLFNRKFSDLFYLEKIFKLLMIGFFFVFSFSGIFLTFLYFLKFIFKSNNTTEDTFNMKLSLYIILSILAVSFAYKSGEFRYFVPVYPVCLFLTLTNKKILQLLTFKSEENKN
jgi:hypothetical protein